MRTSEYNQNSFKPPYYAMQYPWLMPTWKNFIRLVQADRLPHAVLLTGAAGTGKSYLVREIARHLLTKTDAEQHLYNSADGHPDLIWVTPEGKADVIKIDQIRTATEVLSKTAQQGGYRILVITPADRLNKAAANALLKCLEEPGAHTLIVLISASPHLLLPTLRSRCQRWHLQVAFDAGSAWLRTQQVPQDIIDTYWPVLQGAPLALLEQFQNGQLQERTRFREHILTAKNPLGNLQTFESISMITLLNWALELIKDTLQQEKSLYKIQAFCKGWDQLIQLKSLLEQQILPNPVLLRERIFIDCHRLFQG